MAHYMHLYPFSRYLIQTIDERMARLDGGSDVAASPAYEAAAVA